MQILGSGYNMNVLLQFLDESDFPNSEIHDLMGSFPISKHISGCESHLIFSEYEMSRSGLDHNMSTLQSWKKTSVKWVFSTERN